MTDQVAVEQLLLAVENLGNDVKYALEHRTAPDSFKFAGLTLAQFQAMFGTDTVANLEQLTQDFIAFVARRDNPHAVTKSQVGLGLVQNFAPATSGEAITALASDKYMTPATNRAAFDARWAEKVGSAPSELRTIEAIALAIVAERTRLDSVEQLAEAAETPIGAQTKVDALANTVAVQLAGKLNADGTAANSLKLSGYTLAEVITQAAAAVDLSGKLNVNGQAQDSLRLNGKTQAELTASIAEVIAGNVSTKWATPQGVKAAIDAAQQADDTRLDALEVDVNTLESNVVAINAERDAMYSELTAAFDAIGL